MVPEGTYLGLERFKAQAHGLDLSPFTDFQLEGALADAAAIVDSYCNVPLLPTPHSFLGGVAIGEEHKWKFPMSSNDRGTRRVYPKHWPIKELQKFEIIVGMNSAGMLPSNALVINNAERWIELTALTISSNSGLFGLLGWVVPIGGLQIPVAKIDYTYGWDLPVVSERARRVAEGSKTFQLGHGFLTDAPVEVKAAATTLLEHDDYELDREEGRLTLVNDTHEDVRVSYVHKLPREIPQANGLVAAALLGDARLRAKGMEGLSALKVNEITLQRPRKVANDEPNFIDDNCPAAAALLAGFRFWSMG